MFRPWEFQEPMMKYQENSLLNFTQLTWFSRILCNTHRLRAGFFVLGWCANARSSSLTYLHVSKLKEFLTERPQSSCLRTKPLSQQTEKKLPIVVLQLKLLSYRGKLVREQRCMVACIVSIPAYFAQFHMNCSGRGWILQFTEKDFERKRRASIVKKDRYNYPLALP